MTSQSENGLGSGIAHFPNVDANSSGVMLMSTATVVQLVVTFIMGRVVGS